MRLKEDKSKRGAFIALYGANNLGKSTQLKKLVTKLVEDGHQSFLVIKYPIYQLEPTGQQLNDILRGQNQLNINPKSLEMQKLYVQNRIDFQPTLIETLNSGIDVISEDYTGTGIAWGLTWGLKLKDLENLNYGLIKPDYELVLDGERFGNGVEKGHKFESAGEIVWNKNRRAHTDLAKKYGWEVFNANEDPTKVHQQIWKYLAAIFEHRHKIPTL